MKDVFDIMAEEDLTPDLQMLADVCGMETVKDLLRNFSGLSFYIPKISRLETLVMKYMKQNSVKSFKTIARELNVSEQFLKTVRKRSFN